MPDFQEKQVLHIGSSDATDSVGSRFVLLHLAAYLISWFAEIAYLVSYSSPYIAEFGLLLDLL